VGRCGLDSFGSRYGLVAGSCEHGDEPSGHIKGVEFLDQLSDCWLLEKDSARWSYLVT
jgi:hypothetical protein